MRALSQIKRQMGERGTNNLRKGWDQKYVAKRIISEEYYEIAEESIEEVTEESKMS